MTCYSISMAPISSNSGDAQTPITFLEDILRQLQKIQDESLNDSNLLNSQAERLASELDNRRLQLEERKKQTENEINAEINALNELRDKLRTLRPDSDNSERKP